MLYDDTEALPFRPDMIFGSCVAPGRRPTKTSTVCILCYHIFATGALQGPASSILRSRTPPSPIVTCPNLNTFPVVSGVSTSSILLIRFCPRVCAGLGESIPNMENGEVPGSVGHELAKNRH